MGAYLSQPNTEKLSSDHINEIVAVGASSMQGWRNSQEDAHNSILDFDKDTSLFAVYDGHGGAEVAAYCAENFPEFLKNLQTYKEGNFEQALKDAFLGFDQTLLETHVIEILKIIAGEKNNIVEPVDDMEEDDVDLAELHEESNLPLNEVIGKNYKGHPSMPVLNKLQELIGKSGINNSPYLRGRRAAAVAADNANRAVLLDADSNPEGSSTSAAAAAAAVAAAKAALKVDDGPGPSSSSSFKKPSNDDVEDESAVSSSSSSKTSSKLDSGVADLTKLDDNKSEAAAAENGDEANAESKAASTVTTTPNSNQECEQNGSVSSSEAKAAINASDSSTSSPSSSVKVSSNIDNENENENEVNNEAVTGSNDKAADALKVKNGDASASEIASSASQTASSTTDKKETNKKSMEITEDSTDDDDDDDENEFKIENSILCDTQRAIMEFGSDDEEDEDADLIDGDDDDDDDDDDEDDDDDDDDDEADDEDDDMEDDGIYEEFYSNMIEEPGKDSGCTAVVGLLHGRDLYVANAGDSRCVVCRNGKAIEMSLDHKPEDEEEANRIMNAGGKVTLDGRVNGGLNLSRAIGDHAYKRNANLSADKQMISALPDIRKLIISPEDEFMILACDGIWNSMSSDDVVQFIGKRINNENKKLSEICEELFDNCLAPNTVGDGTGCDNMTAVIIKFKPKLLELKSALDPNETEDVLAVKRQAAAAEEAKKKLELIENENMAVELDANHHDIDPSTITTTTAATSILASSSTSMKRCASPSFCEGDNDDDDDTNEAKEAMEGNKTKKIKTDDNKEDRKSESLQKTDGVNAANENAAAKTTNEDGVVTSTPAAAKNFQNDNNATSSSSSSSNGNDTSSISGVDNNVADAQDVNQNECTSTSSTAIKTDTKQLTPPDDEVNSEVSST